MNNRNRRRGAQSNSNQYARNREDRFTNDYNRNSNEGYYSGTNWRNRNSDQDNYRSSYENERNINNRGGSYDQGYKNEGYQDENSYEPYFDSMSQGRRRRSDFDYGYGSQSDYNSQNDSGSFQKERRFGTQGGYASQDSGNFGDFGANDSSWNRKGSESSWGDEEDQNYGRQRRNNQHQGQFRGKGPKGYKRSDDRIREDINDRLSDDSYLDATEIEVTVEGGEVTLTGSVSDRNGKRRAEEIAEEISGVINVENRIRVSRQDQRAKEENYRKEESAAKANVHNGSRSKQTSESNR